MGNLFKKSVNPIQSNRKTYVKRNGNNQKHRCDKHPGKTN